KGSAIMNYLTHALREHQELAVFLTLAIGFLIGRVRIGSFSLGTTVGTLLAGVAIGQLNIGVPAVVKYVFFDLFLFTTGYKVGPQFFRALKKDALPQVAITLVLCITCLLAAFTAAKLLGYDMGTAAGLLAGAFTESTVIGTASKTLVDVARDVLRHQRRADFFCVERGNPLIERADLRPLRVAEHRAVYRFGHVIVREFGGRAHVDHLVKGIELCYRNGVRVFQFHR